MSDVEYTHYNVAQAKAALEEADRILIRNKMELARLKAQRDTLHGRRGYETQYELVRQMQDRRDYIAGQYEIAKKNAAMGIAPIGPRKVRKPRRPRTAKEQQHDD